MHNLKLHHIGVATRSIARELPVFQALGYQKCSEAFVDPGQKIRGLFIAAPNQPMLELLENTEASGPLDSCLKNGIKFYHFSYVVEAIEPVLEALVREQRAKVVVPVTTAVYFQRICFVMLPNMMLIELVECAAAGEAFVPLQV